MTRTNSTRRNAIPSLATLLSCLLLSSCSMFGYGDGSGVKDSAWIEASPILEQQIQDEVSRLPWTHGFERLEQIRWFASVGEPAYPALLALVNDPRDDVAAAALASLGATMDRRLVASVREIEWSEARAHSDLRHERARTLLRLGDWSEIPTLIDGLRDKRVYTRSLALESLKESTQQTMGFDPHSDEEARLQGIDRWERWWLDRSNDELLSVASE